MSYKILFARHRLVFAAILALILTACGGPSRTQRPAILVAAASDLVKVGPPLAEAFERSSGVEVTFSFGSSGQLEQQIRHGASFDVYAPAARSFCQALERDGLSDGEDRLYALGRLVAWSKTLRLTSLKDLTDARVRRIAIANPRYAPYGVAAQEALQAAGLWTSVQPKIVYGETVAHALELAETGNADVALVAIALVQKSEANLLTIDPGLYRPMEQAAVVLKASGNKAAARAFVEFLQTPEAQRILAEYGFARP